MLLHVHTQIRNVLNLINMFYLMNSSVPNFHGRFKSGYEININITRLFDYMYASPVMYMCKDDVGLELIYHIVTSTTKQYTVSHRLQNSTQCHIDYKIVHSVTSTTK